MEWGVGRGVGLKYAVLARGGASGCDGSSGMRAGCGWGGCVFFCRWMGWRLMGERNGKGEVVLCCVVLCCGILG